MSRELHHRIDKISSVNKYTWIRVYSLDLVNSLAHKNANYHIERCWTLDQSCRSRVFMRRNTGLKFKNELRIKLSFRQIYVENEF